ncbi:MULTISPECIES: Ppx/GppA family phosphatase [unclassified Shinella]|jgi:exopolyphosphatase/guanosine-5'-triphosphate,3'-diphosphate pyrophosphatase|uniref:Ppx/GppA family phosphatase n=1 Tax=unclassified Shinella TaxID=2643062 RepID=UPI0003C553D6|nr:MULTISPECIES: Ppx/GppA phosphatase family protein [unclassified Shinella]MCA0338783.1 Ppx/GppA family phosphatase [Pseudomonadota bacterium]EYR80809.1 Ppx/GppA phosphatase [Shinella sp. DD12]KNY17586.1 exopolyphosphatase [Shinella sp. SUS2]KOC75048.1 exopolyphosphatase [Shinella sp. GWS1]MCO5150336.1 Ppx/GppA family phosphatase [Shinella sp.]
MVESEAQGRLPGIAPVSVVDIGSNSIRLVIYEGMSRSPAILFNEKVMCGLGKGLAKTGRMDPASVERALAALHRFKALSWQARASTMFALATAAAREAENGPDFIHQAQLILGQKIRVLTGEEEAYFSALGIVSGFHDPDGIVGDLGGGSLELVDVAGAMIGRGITLPLGGIRLSEASGGSTAQARIVARKYLRTANLLKNGTGRAFYAVGGTWRAIGALHMEVQNYPLHMIQGYELGFADAMDFLTDIVTAKDQKDAAYAAISKGRRNLLPFGAVALQETIALMKPSRVFFSAQGVREGFLYSLLPDREKGRDPLLAAAGELAILRARSPEHARELAEWTGRMMPFFGITETEEERRYREAACLLADISWRAHPDYRGLQALNLIAHGTFIGITHPGRAFIALTNYYRFEGLNDDAVSSSLAAIATPRLRELAKLVGALLRIVYPFSASMPGVVPHLSIRKSSAPDTDLEFVVPADFSELAGERLDGRLQQLAKLTGRKLAFRFL